MLLQVAHGPLRRRRDRRTRRARVRDRLDEGEVAEGAPPVLTAPDPPQSRRLPQALCAAAAGALAATLPALQLLQPHPRREAPRAPAPLDRSRLAQPREDLQAGRRGQDPGRDPLPLPPAASRPPSSSTSLSQSRWTWTPGCCSAVGGRFWSQYREVLLPANRHAPEAVSYFLDRLNDTRHFRMPRTRPAPPPSARAARNGPSCCCPRSSRSAPGGGGSARGRPRLRPARRHPRRRRRRRSRRPSSRSCACRASSSCMRW